MSVSLRESFCIVHGLGNRTVIKEKTTGNTKTPRGLIRFNDAQRSSAIG